jgi:putative ABC transport system permease protein
MINNRGLTLLLGTGFMLVVAMVSVIPLYTDGVLQKVLTADLEAAQTANHVFPGNYSIQADFSYMEKGERLHAFSSLKQNLQNKLLPQIPLPTLSTAEEITIASGSVKPQGRDKDMVVGTNVFFRALMDMEKHITITHGRMCSPAISDRTIEVIVTPHFLNENRFYLDDTLLLGGETSGLPFSQARIVGVFEISKARDTFWATSPDFTTMYVNDILHPGQGAAPAAIGIVERRL